jgi:hypothetical protein
VEALRDGLNRLVRIEHLQLFSEAELSLLLAGACSRSKAAVPPPPTSAPLAAVLQGASPNEGQPTPTLNHAEACGSAVQMVRRTGREC